MLKKISRVIVEYIAISFSWFLAKINVTTKIKHCIVDNVLSKSNSLTEIFHSFTLSIRL
jgi:hypothetical protein